MRLKKVLLMALAVLLVLGLAACGSTGTDDTKDTAATDEKALKIAIVSSPSGVDDGSFNQNNYEGIQAFIAKHPGSTVKAIKEEDMAQSIPAVQNIVADYDVIVTPGYQFAGISEIAQQNPDKKFILVDSFPSDPTDPTNAAKTAELDNVYAMTFKEQEGGFFAGIAAAESTKSGKVAVINGQAFPSNIHYQKGFEAGVNYANKNFGSKAECVSLESYSGGKGIGGNYIGSFDDVATGKKVAEAVIGEGADVLFVAAGGAGNGAITAAKESNGKVKIIGCDTNQFKDGENGSENVMLTSALKIMDVQVERQLNAIYDGTFKGENVNLGVKEDGTGYVSEEGQQQLSEKTLADLKTAYDAVKAGTIVPPTGDAGTTETPTEFPGL